MGINNQIDSRGIEREKRSDRIPLYIVNPGETTWSRIHLVGSVAFLYAHRRSCESTEAHPRHRYSGGRSVTGFPGHLQAFM